MKEFIKFFGVGGVSTIVDYIIYFLMITLGFDYVVAIVFGYALGFWVNYTLGRKYVFVEGSKTTSGHSEFIRVFLIAFIGLLLNILIVHMLSVRFFTLDLSYSRIIAIGMVFVYNYSARKLFVYN